MILSDLGGSRAGRWRRGVAQGAVPAPGASRPPPRPAFVMQIVAPPPAAALHALPALHRSLHPPIIMKNIHLGSHLHSHYRRTAFTAPMV